MGLKRDLTILGIMITVLVSFTLSWSTNDLGPTWTADAAQYVDTPVQVTNSTNFLISNYKLVTLTVCLYNPSESVQNITLETQALDENGDIIANENTELTNQTKSFLIDSKKSKNITIIFEFDHIDRYLEEFLIAVTGASETGPTYTMTWSLTSNGSSEATLVVVGYATTTGTPYVPKVKLYDPPWEDQTLLSTGYYVHQVQTAFNPNWKSRFEIVAVVLGTYSSSSSQFWLYAYVYNGVDWSDPYYLGTGTGWNSYPAACPFDVVYETTSSRAIVVWNNKYESNNVRDLAYMIWDGENWGDGTTAGSIGYLNTIISGESDTVDDFSYIRLEANPTTDSNQVALAGLTKGLKVKCFVWDSASWGNGLGLCTSSYPTPTASYQCFDIAYEYTTGNIVAAGSYGTGSSNRARISTFDGSSWSSISSNQMGSNTIYWLILKSHNVVDSNKLMLISLDSGSDIYARYYSGSSWGSRTAIDTGVESSTTRCVDGDWLPSGETFLLVAGENGVDQISYKTFTPPNTWSQSSNKWDTVSVSSVTDQKWVQVRSNPKNEDPLMVIGVVDDASDLTIMRWTGSSIEIYDEFTPYSSVSYEGFSIACSFP